MLAFQKRLGKKDEAAEFLTLASHQLRTPVSAIKGVTSMLKEGDFDNCSRRKRDFFVRGLYEKAVKLENVVNDILLAAEISSGIRIKKEEIDTQAFIAEAVDKFAKSMAERKMDFKLAIKGPLSNIFGDKQFLKEVLANIIENALRFTPSTKADSYSRKTCRQKGKIRVTVLQKCKNIIFCISDNGISIPAGENKKIFERFQRGSNARQMYTDGSGLGLFIAKKIIESHGGRIWAQSGGRGSKFFVSLPILGSC